MTFGRGRRDVSGVIRARRSERTTPAAGARAGSRPPTTARPRSVVGGPVTSPFMRGGPSETLGSTDRARAHLAVAVTHGGEKNDQHSYCAGAGRVLEASPGAERNSSAVGTGGRTRSAPGRSSAACTRSALSTINGAGPRRDIRHKCLPGITGRAGTRPTAEPWAITRHHGISLRRDRRGRRGPARRPRPPSSPVPSALGADAPVDRSLKGPDGCRTRVPVRVAGRRPADG